MIHNLRVFDVRRVEDPEFLAMKLTQQTWCLCTGWLIGSKYLFLNDSFSEDGAQEYAAMLRKPLPGKRNNWLQIETITFSWMEIPDAAKMIRRILDGEFDELSNFGEYELFLNHNEPCIHCA